MSHEATKTRSIRGEEFARTFLRGRVIDIGCGPDVVIAHAEPFDLEHGDAQEIGKLREHGAYDAVCSSHCLEHMRDVRGALEQWWSLVRDGGCLIIVVPDEDLYEQGGWPSLFNSDHKATFRLRKPTSWSPVSFDIEELVGELQGAEIVSCELQDNEYNYRLRKLSISRIDRMLFRMERRWSGLCRRLGLSDTSLARYVTDVLVRLGCPVDQTAGPALAQIQIIARKHGNRRSMSEDSRGPKPAI